MGKRYKLIILNLIIFVVILILFGFSRVNNNVLLIVNGEKIRKEEYDFLSSCPMQYIDSYEDEKYDLNTRKILLTRAEQILLKESGIIEDYSYDKFLEQLTKENEKRKEAIENNQAIYGPKQYDKKVYFDYYYSECRNYYVDTILSNSNNADQDSKKLDRMYEEILLSKVKAFQVIKNN
ncbi:MAG: hypothetical protein ACERKZ_12745 [Lachnotalea sp.]